MRARTTVASPRFAYKVFACHLGAVFREQLQLRIWRIPVRMPSLCSRVSRPGKREIELTQVSAAAQDRILVISRDRRTLFYSSAFVFVERSVRENFSSDNNFNPRLTIHRYINCHFWWDIHVLFRDLYSVVTFQHFLWLLICKLLTIFFKFIPIILSIIVFVKFDYLFFILL